MHLTKHKNHRNLKYLNWLRKRNCLISHSVADVAHHVRLGTNGGKGLKPSDYFCIPLTHEFHTTGIWAVHSIGEQTFNSEFKLDVLAIFEEQLLLFLHEEYDCLIKLRADQSLENIAEIIAKIEQLRPARKKSERKPEKIKANKTKIFLKRPSRSSSLVDNEYYQKSKELKKLRDKSLRAQLKEMSKEPSVVVKSDEYYQQAKEFKKIKDKEFRDQNKARQSAYRKEQYRKLKESRA